SQEPSEHTPMPPRPQPGQSMLPGAPEPEVSKAAWVAYYRECGDRLLRRGRELVAERAEKPETFKLQGQVYRSEGQERLKQLSGEEWKELDWFLREFNDQMRKIGEDLKIDWSQ